MAVTFGRPGVRLPGHPRGRSQTAFADLPELLPGRRAQGVEHTPGLHGAQLLVRINLNHAMHVFGEIHDDGDIATLASETGAATTGQERRLELVHQRHRLLHIVRVSRNHHADRHLSIIGAVRRVEGSAARIEAHFASELFAQAYRQRLRCPAGTRGALIVETQALEPLVLVLLAQYCQADHTRFRSGR